MTMKTIELVFIDPGWDRLDFLGAVTDAGAAPLRLRTDQGEFCLKAVDVTYQHGEGSTSTLTFEGPIIT